MRVGRLISKGFGAKWEELSVFSIFLLLAMVLIFAYLIFRSCSVLWRMAALESMRAVLSARNVLRYGEHLLHTTFQCLFKKKKNVCYFPSPGELSQSIYY